jgi:hypothetical protein
MFVEILVSAIAGYIVWRQETIEKEIKQIEIQIDNIERVLPKRKDDLTNY